MKNAIMAKINKTNTPWVRFMGQWVFYNMIKVRLNCQSEVRIFRIKNKKNHKFTLTKEYGIYRDISRFSEPKEAAIDKVGLTLTGCWWKCYNAGFEGEKSTDISEFPSPSVKTEQHNSKDYSNEEDFYDDHYDDFFDYYDAEDFYNRHQ